MFGKWKKLYEVTETRLRIQIEHNRELTKYQQLYQYLPDSEVCLYDYLEKPLKRAILDNIDVFNEPRCGHGSYALERFIYLMKDDGVDYIEGKLLQDSPIGIENLRNFYRKNKFDVSGNSFKLVLNKDK